MSVKFMFPKKRVQYIKQETYSQISFKEISLETKSNHIYRLKGYTMFWEVLITECSMLHTYSQLNN